MNPKKILQILLFIVLVVLGPFIYGYLQLRFDNPQLFEDFISDPLYFMYITNLAENLMNHLIFGFVNLAIHFMFFSEKKHKAPIKSQTENKTLDFKSSSKNKLLKSQEKTDIGNSTECENCNQTLKENQKFCSKCGAKIIKNLKESNTKKLCGECGKELKANQKFCPSCGKKTDLKSQENDSKPTKEKTKTLSKEAKILSAFFKIKGIDFSNVKSIPFNPMNIPTLKEGIWMSDFGQLSKLYILFNSEDELNKEVDKLLDENKLEKKYDEGPRGIKIIKGNGFNIEIPPSGGGKYFLFIVNEDLVHEKFDEFNILPGAKEIEVNWIYGFDKVYDYYRCSKEHLQQQSVPFYWFEEEDNLHIIVIRVVNKKLAIKYIDKLIALNGSTENFEKIKDQDGWEYLHTGDLFHIGYLEQHSCVRINKVTSFEFFSDDIKYGINENDKKIRNLVKGLNKIFYNEGEGPENGRFCVRGDKDSSFTFAYYDGLDESLGLFRKIVENYDPSHEVFKKDDKTLDKIINGDGIEYKNEKFELMLIRENVKYKFYITPPGGFFFGKWDFS